MSEDEHKVVEAMETYGGSFVKTLAQGFRVADPSNFKKLKNAFDGYWEQYSEIARLRG